jgi:hypothetical protein
MQPYSSVFTGDKLYKKEIRVVLELKSQGYNDQFIREKIITENLFQLRSERAIKDTIGKVLRRVRFIPDDLAQHYLQGTRFDEQAILLYSFLQAYRLPRELVMEVIYFSYNMGRKRISLQDVHSFFERKAEESEVVGAWSKETTAKIRQITLQTLRECELLIPAENYFKIMPVPISPQLREYARLACPMLLRYTLNE